MKTERIRTNSASGRWIVGMKFCAFCVAAWLAGIQLTYGQIITPLYVGNLEPIRNEHGQLMPGSRVGGGEPIVSLVEVHSAPDGIIRPPAPTGEAHPLNPLMEDGSGGMGENVMSPDMGLFCLLFRYPPSAGTKLFVRVYNAPTAGEASFYLDSRVVEVAARASSLVVEFGDIQPIDGGDDDGDGLSNSWEVSLGTADRQTADYDGDGMSDLDEMRAGTEATNSQSLFSFRSIESDPELSTSGEAVPADMLWQKPVSVVWQSVPGKTYQLEYAPIPMVAGEVAQDFVPVGDAVTAGEEEHEIEILVDVPEDTSRGMFRVRLVTEE